LTAGIQSPYVKEAFPYLICFTTTTKGEFERESLTAGIQSPYVHTTIRERISESPSLLSEAK